MISNEMDLSLFCAMDLSSNSKCSSDFSIDRILSDDSKSRDPAPSWLCCTRYQPPRLPRTGSACRSRRSGRHARVPFTAAQAAALEAAYSRAPYLAPPALRALASALQLRDDRIKIWFQNRRARERREKCVTIPPPHSTPLLSNQRPSWFVPQPSAEYVRQPKDLYPNQDIHEESCKNESEDSNESIYEADLDVVT